MPLSLWSNFSLKVATCTGGYQVIRTSVIHTGSRVRIQIRARVRIRIRVRVRIRLRARVRTRIRVRVQLPGAANGHFLFHFKNRILKFKFMNSGNIRSALVSDWRPLDKREPMLLNIHHQPSSSLLFCVRHPLQIMQNICPKKQLKFMNFMHHANRNRTYIRV